MSYKLSKKDILKETIKCGKEPSYFINNYAKISHPMHGLIPFKTYGYQDDLLSDFNCNCCVYLLAIVVLQRQERSRNRNQVPDSSKLS